MPVVPERFLGISRPLAGWVLFEFGYVLLLTNVVTIYFPLWVVDDAGGRDVHFAIANGLAMAIVLVVAPAIGAESDRAGRRIPLLAALFTVCGIFGGWVAGVRILGVDAGTYFSSLESAVDFSDDVSGSLLKAVIFGMIVGLIATYRGYTSAPTSAGVSASTTGTVVVASVTILISDYFITALWGV